MNIKIIHDGDITVTTEQYDRYKREFDNLVKMMGYSNSSFTGLDPFSMYVFMVHKLGYTSVKTR